MIKFKEVGFFFVYRERDDRCEEWDELMVMVMVEESGGDSRRYLRWDCNRSDILHQLTKKKKNARGASPQERANPGPESIDPRPTKHANNNNKDAVYAQVDRCCCSRYIEFEDPAAGCVTPGSYRKTSVCVCA